MYVSPRNLQERSPAVGPSPAATCKHVFGVGLPTFGRDGTGTLLPCFSVGRRRLFVDDDARLSAGAFGVERWTVASCNTIFWGTGRCHSDSDSAHSSGNEPANTRWLLYTNGLY